MAIEEQVCVVYAGVRGFLDKMQTSEISKFEQNFLAHLRNNHPAIVARIRDTGALSPADDKELKNIIEAFIPESGCAMKA